MQKDSQPSDRSPPRAHPDGTPDPKGQGPSDAPVRLGFVAARLARIAAWAQRRNHASALHGNPAIYDPGLFPWVRELEESWPVIRSELSQLIMQRGALPRDTRFSAETACNRGWTTYPLSDYFSRSNDIIAKCPETWRLVQKVPGLVGAMFSVLEPGRSLPLHRGPYNGLLRMHLGLIVPDPREAVGIRIDGKVCHWEEGRALIFDDTFAHEARNASATSRIVLFIDFERPLAFPARFINRRLLRSRLFSPFVREGSGVRGRWAQRVYEQMLALRQAQPTTALAIRRAPPPPAIVQDLAPPRATLQNDAGPDGSAQRVGPRIPAKSLRDPGSAALPRRESAPRLAPRPTPRPSSRPARAADASPGPNRFRNNWPYDEERVR